MDMKQIGALLLECVDITKAKKVLAYSVILPMLEKIVADTDNKFDDQMLGYIKQWFEKNI